MSDLRDHSQPCDHGKRHTHASIPPGEVMEAMCPGGREVIIDLEPPVWMSAYERIGWQEAIAVLGIGDIG